jgi:hypothetical protein
MGIATTYNDAWSTHGKPLTDDSPPIMGSASPDAADGPSSAGQDHSFGGMVTQWAETAFGPAITNVGRELGAMARQLTAPGQMKNPWLWIGAAGVVGYVLGRSGALRPLASFTARTAFTTLVERALRGS